MPGLSSAFLRPRKIPASSLGNQSPSVLFNKPSGWARSGGSVIRLTPTPPAWVSLPIRKFLPTPTSVGGDGSLKNDKAIQRL